ncbi:MAG: DUF4260 family protein [Bacteroidetes bacterium]|nr:DUF4260 family protein [Bacteroidota bacterium]
MQDRRRNHQVCTVDPPGRQHCAWHTLPITIPAPLPPSTGIIPYGHACLGGLLGFGLKYNGNFRHTHLGRIGKGRASGEH